MAGIERWKKILTPANDKVRVDIGGRVADLTRTQAYRFDQLSKSWQSEPEPCDPQMRTRYPLDEAAALLEIAESSVLSRAATGLLRVFVNASGLAGRWRIERADGSVDYSEPCRLESGYLALPPRSCAELVDKSCAEAHVLEFHLPEDRSAIGFEPGQLRAILDSEASARYFCLDDTLAVERKAVTLLAPLRA